MLRVCGILLVCVAAIGATPVAVAIPEASPVAVASPVPVPVAVASPVPVADPAPVPVADPAPVPVAAADPVPAPLPVPVAQPVAPVVIPVVPEVVKEDDETVAKVQEVPEAVAPQARSLDGELFNNNDVPKGGRVVVADAITSEDALLRKLNTRCAQKDSSSCVLLKMVTYFNRLLKKSSFAVGETVEIERTSAVSVAAAEGEETSRSLEGETDEEKLSNLMTDKLYNFVRSRSLRVKLLPGADLLVTPNKEKDGSLNLGMSLQSNKDEGRGKKTQNIVSALVAAGAVKIGMLKILAMKALVLLVGKAIILSKIAFLVAAAIGLKKLFSQSRHVTYEVVAQPHHSHSTSHHESSHGSSGHDSYSSGGGGGGWGRSLGENAQDLAYRAHRAHRDH